MMKHVLFFAISIIVLAMASAYSENTYGEGCFGNVSCGEVTTQQTTPSDTSNGGSSRGGSSRTTTRAVLTTNLTENTNRSVLFDVGLRLPERQILPGERLSGIVSLLNFQLPGKVNVTLLYEIVDATGKRVYQEEQQLELETQTEFIKEFATQALPLGSYIITAQLFYQGQQEPASGSANFEVVTVRTSPVWRNSYLIYALVLLVAGLAVYRVLRLRKVMYPVKREIATDIFDWKIEQ